MDHDLYVALLTVGGMLVVAIIVYLAGRVTKVWKSPKRLDRVEGNQVHMMNMMEVVFDISSLNIRALQGHRINGELEDAQKKMADSREDYRKYVNGQSVSRAETKWS